MSDQMKILLFAPIHRSVCPFDFIWPFNLKNSCSMLACSFSSKFFPLDHKTHESLINFNDLPGHRLVRTSTFNDARACLHFWIEKNGGEIAENRLQLFPNSMRDEDTNWQFLCVDKIRWNPENWYYFPFTIIMPTFEWGNAKHHPVLSNNTFLRIAWLKGGKVLIKERRQSRNSNHI